MFKMVQENIIVKHIKARFPDSVLEVKSFRGEVTLIIKKEAIVEVCRFCRDDRYLQFNFLSDLCGVDKIAVNATFEVVYHLYSLPLNHRVRLKVLIPVSPGFEPSAPSVTSVWPTANWHERETFDMFGIKFENHPDLRRILTPEGFVGYPFRKDYPVDKRQPEDLRGIYRKE